MNTRTHSPNVRNLRWPWLLLACGALFAVGYRLGPAETQAARLTDEPEASVHRSSQGAIPPVSRLVAVPHEVRTSGLEGLVTAEGIALEGATVCATEGLQHVAATEPARCVRSDAQGRYALEDLRPGLYTVTGTAEGRASRVANEGRPVRLLAHTTEDVALELGPKGAKLAGDVLDVLGGPVADANVRLVRQGSRGRATLEFRSKDDGSFASWVEPGEWIVYASASGYTGARTSAVAPSAHVRLELAPGGAIHGQVVERRTQVPVEGVEVRAVRMRTNPLVAPSSRSDAEGRFVISSLDPGVYGLSAAGPRSRGESPHLIELALGDVARHVVVEV